MTTRRKANGQFAPSAETARVQAALGKSRAQEIPTLMGNSVPVPPCTECYFARGYVIVMQPLGRDGTGETFFTVQDCPTCHTPKARLRDAVLFLTNPENRARVEARLREQFGDKPAPLVMPADPLGLYGHAPAPIVVTSRKGKP